MTGLRVSRQLVILPIMALLLFFWTPKTGLVGISSAKAQEYCATTYGIPGWWSGYGNFGGTNYMPAYQTDFYLYNKCDPTTDIWTEYYYNEGSYYFFNGFPSKPAEYSDCEEITQNGYKSLKCNAYQAPYDSSIHWQYGASTMQTPWLDENQEPYNPSCICVANEPLQPITPPEPPTPPINNATSTIDVDFDNYIAQQRWVNLTGDCSPEETTKLVYVYQSNTTALPSDNYNIVGIQQGISSDYFNVYAEPCDDNGRWSRIVFLEKGQNYFTTYTRQQDFGTTWNATSHSNTVKVLYNYNFDFSLTSPAGVDSFKFGYKYRVFNGKILYGNDDLFLIGHFNNGSLIGNEASFFVDELSPTSSVYYLIRSDIWSGVLNDEYKMSCDNYPSGCLYALKMDEDELNDTASAGERLYSISFYGNNNKDNLFARYIFKINWATDPEDPDIVWGLPIDSSWSTSTNPYLPPEQSDETLTQALDRFYTIYSADNICGRDDDGGNVIENIVKFIPIRICRLGHYLIMPKKSTIERLIGIGDVFLDSFPWSIPFIITDSMMDSLEKAKVAENARFSVPISFYYNNATTTIDVSDPVYDTINKIGSTKLYWVFNGLTFRELSGVLLTFSVIIFSGVLIVRLVKKKSDPED